MNYKSLSPAERIQHTYETYAGQVILTTSSGETSAAMPHLMAAAIGRPRRSG